MGPAEEWRERGGYDRTNLEWQRLGRGRHTVNCIAGESANTMKPPQTFQPPMPVTNSAPSATSTSTSAPKAAPPDLITRYNLASKIKTSEGVSGEHPSLVTKGKQSWSANKVERQSLLQQRREEMILAARKKMEARLKGEDSQKETTV